MNERRRRRVSWDYEIFQILPIKSGKMVIKRGEKVRLRKEMKNQMWRNLRPFQLITCRWLASFTSRIMVVSIWLYCLWIFSSRSPSSIIATVRSSAYVQPAGKRVWNKTLAQFQVFFGPRQTWFFYLSLSPLAPVKCQFWNHVNCSAFQESWLSYPPSQDQMGLVDILPIVRWLSLRLPIQDVSKYLKTDYLGWYENSLNSIFERIRGVYRGFRKGRGLEPRAPCVK